MMASQVVALAAILGGSNRLIERLGETEATRAIERCLKRMERSLAGHGGHLVGTTDGELLATFDSAEAACLAAIDMQQRVATLPPVSGLKLPIRIGLHALAPLAAGQASATPALVVATRIAGLAEDDQILASAALLAGLPALSSVAVSRSTSGLVGADGRRVELLSIAWQTHDEHRKGSPATRLAEPAAKRLAVLYRGHSFVVDAHSARLTIGRDASCQLVIDDRKASRSHGLIERRDHAYFYVDRSSNGSQVRLAGRQEVKLRHQEIELSGSGRIFFGGPGDDPQTACADFEIS